MNRNILAAFIALGFLVIAGGARILDLERALAAKPKIEIRTVEKIKTVRVAGPVQIKERIVSVPGGQRVVERTILRDSVTTDTGKESAAERSEAPACAPVARRARFVGVVLDPQIGAVPEGVRGGLTIFESFDLATGYRFHGRAVGLFVDAAFRF